MENKIILHRGYKGKYPENSKLSFYYALKENRPFETDIRVSNDGVVYLIHDDSLDRLFNGSGKIEELNSEELGKFRYKEDSSQKLFSLNELCELIRLMNYNNLIFIHIKEVKDIPKVIEILEKYNLQKIARFFAVDETEKQFKELMRTDFPEYKIGLYFSDGSEINEEEFEKADFIWADEKTDKENITKKMVDFAHSLGKPIYAISPELIPESSFNSDIEKRWKHFLDIGVNGVCTDLPEEFVKLLKLRESGSK
jgi:glycerophosphoryl diester phosphodiesterase